MQKIIDKHLLYVMGMLFLLSGEIETLPVFTMLIALIYTELGIYYGNKKMQIGLAILYMGASLFCPMLVFFMPVVFYHVVEHHFLWGFCGVLLFFIHISVFNEPWKIVLWWMLFGLAILLAERTKEQEKNKKILYFCKNSFFVIFHHPFTLTLSLITKLSIFKSFKRTSS